MNKLVFKVEDTEYAVVKPSSKQLSEAQKVYNKAFREALESGAILRETMDTVLKEQGLWNDDKQKEYDNLNEKFRSLEIRLAKGKMHKAEGKKIALQMKELRSKIRDLMESRNTLDSHTAQAQADRVHFNYLVSCCTVYNDTGKPVFIDLDDYLSKSMEVLGFTAASNFATLFYELDNNYEKNLPENKFLVRFKYVDEDLRLIDSDGNYVDEDGRKLDKNGRYVDNLGRYVDKYGNRIDEKGNLVIEDAGPFFDDDNNPIN